MSKYVRWEWNPFIRNDDNEGEIKYGLNNKTGKVGLDTGPGWTDRCSNCYVKTCARKVQIDTLTYAHEMM